MGSLWGRQMPVIAALAAILACGGARGGDMAGEERDWEGLRARMVDQQIRARGVRDPRVLEAMRTVPRHLFVPEPVRDEAYQDRPLPIGEGQTISQPYMVAVMTELLDLEPGERVLEVGTGSGYQAAVLAALTEEVWSLEILPALARRARAALAAVGSENVRVIVGDGYRGLPERAPFDAIVVTAAPEHVPEPLLEQLAPGGRLVIPVGDQHQTLRVLERTEAGVEQTALFDVRFVPMRGEAQERD